MSLEKETDAATVLSQMSQLVGVMPSFDLTSSQDVILEADAIGATCTLQPSSLDSDILFPMTSHHSALVNAKKAQDDPYIGFDDAEHPYAANFVETSNSFLVCKQQTKETSILRPSKASEFLTSSAEDKLTCGICNKQFKSQYNLIVHMQFHKGKKPHMCVVCSKAFTTKSDLKRHGRIHSTDTSRPYKCPTCEKTFRDQATLTRHKKIHNQKSLFKCSHCQKEFSRMDCLKNHVKTHLDTKPFKCHICLSEFTYRSSFNRHLLAHDSGTMFICDVCGKTFRRSDYVDSHKKLVHLEACVSKDNLVGASIPLSNVQNKNSSETNILSKKLKKTKVPKKSKRKRKDSDLIADNNINAIPILMSMAEKKQELFNNKETNVLIDSELISHDNLPSPSNIGNDLITFLNQESEEDDNHVTDDDNDGGSETSEDRLEIWSDSDLQH